MFKTRYILGLCGLIAILSLFFVPKTVGLGEQNAQGKFRYEYTSITGGMYCQVNGKIRSSSNGAIIDGSMTRKLESFNPVFFYDERTTTGFAVSFAYLNNTLYHPINSYYTRRPQADSGYLRASMLAGYFSSSKNPGIYEVATYQAWPRYGVVPAITGITLKFFIDKLNDTNDSNTPISINGRDILFSGPDLKVGLIPKPCLPDVKAPELGITSIGNNAYRVPSNTVINFYVEDRNGQKYTYNGIGVGTFAFKSLNWNDISTGNYDFDANMDNQYGIYSGSLFSRINGFGYSHDYYKTDIENYGNIYWNSLRNRRYENIKGYTGYYYAKSGWNIEEQITIVLSGRDTSPDGPSASQTSITFNTPRAFQLENMAPGNGATNIDPELINVGVSVYDDRAGVDSGNLIVTIRTGSQNGTILKEFTGIDLHLTAYQKFFPAEGVGSVAMTGSLNYAIALTGVGPFPENTTIYVVVSGYDLAYNPNAAQRYFSFTTRKSCKALQCGQGVILSTGAIGTGIFYTQPLLTISGGDFPYLSGNQLICNSQGFSGFDMYTGGDRIDYGVSTGGMFFRSYKSSGLVVNISGGRATLVGNTLYVVKNNIPITTGGVIPGGTTPGGNAGGGSQGGGLGLYKDNCCRNNKTYDLLGSNKECIDYSASYYDGKCYPRSEDAHNIDACKKTEIECAYDYAFSIGSTTMPRFGMADVTGFIIRRHMSKIISNFAIKVLGKTPDLTRKCNFNDIYKESKELQYYAKLSCQLGIMGLLNDKAGSPNVVFNPGVKVNRAQFGTILSRVLFETTFNGGNIWYQPHLQALNKYGIIKNISKPNDIELRGYAFIMLRRIGIIVDRYSSTDVLNIINDYTYDTSFIQNY